MRDDDEDLQLGLLEAIKIVLVYTTEQVEMWKSKPSPASHGAIVTITEILERLTEAAFKIEIDLTKGGGK